MGDVLPKENVCEKENRERLPSPQELQGKIILKGSFKLQRAGVSVHVGFTQSVLVFFPPFAGDSTKSSKYSSQPF